MSVSPQPFVPRSDAVPDPTAHEHVDDLTQPNPVAVVDIDGVVADVRHRVGHLQRQPPDWAGFFSAADLDPVLPVGLERVLSLVEAGHDIVWLTGRPEWLRDTTEDWLAEKGLPAGVLLMRPNHDRRPARVLKASAVRALAAGRPVLGLPAGPPREIAVVVDDDRQVVERLRGDGWPVERADWIGLAVDGADRLADAQEREGRT